ncbi:MAG TPA: glycosyltransferase [Streptosporangiaceae bacterium]
MATAAPVGTMTSWAWIVTASGLPSSHQLKQLGARDAELADPTRGPPGHTETFTGLAHGKRSTAVNTYDDADRLQIRLRTGGNPTMKIALIAGPIGAPARSTAYAYPGDPAAAVLPLAKALAGRGQQVTVYSRKDSAALSRRAAPCRGVTVEYIAAGPPERLTDDELLPHIPAFARQLAERWRRSAPDVAHAHSWTSGLTALAGARDIGLPVVQTFLSLGPDTASDRGQPARSQSQRIRLEAAIGRSARAVLAGTSDQRRELGRLGVPLASVRVVPPGVDTSTFRASGPAATRDRRSRLLMVTGLGERQGLATAARALADVPDAELLVVGGPARSQLADDPGYRALIKLARELGVHDRLRCAGTVSQAGMPALMRSADALVNLTTTEPLATVSLEAMACGLPVIASEAGINGDAVIDGVTGYLVPPARPALLADRIRRLLGSPMLREGFGIAAARRAEDRYSWERISQETLAVYQALPGLRLEAAA